ncbi:PEST proteolytic signal-containing nuclear protein-like isoform X2 [Artemia franciscana]|uniref:PEST proteolytic signal-containing nuclear protein-like isoform X2 n=1 Tax=Artemia franciscana TaxID=6661 RepID=UPI0032DA11F2
MISIGNIESLKKKKKKKMSIGKTYLKSWSESQQTQKRSLSEGEEDTKETADPEDAAFKKLRTTTIGLVEAKIQEATSSDKDHQKNQSLKQTIVVGKKLGPTTIKLGSVAKPVIGPKKPPMPIKSVFNDDSDEEEEMPAEARMRMRNIGRDTPTSSGPNSFGKTKQGFVNTRALTSKKLSGEG